MIKNLMTATPGEGAAAKMQFEVDARPRKVAKALKRALDERGYDFKLKDALHIAARIYGYASWSDLLCSLGTAPPSDYDSLVAPDVVAARRARHVAGLVESGVKRVDAEEVVDEIGPTRNVAFCPSLQPPGAVCSPHDAVVVFQNKRTRLGVTTGKVRTFILDSKAPPQLDLWADDSADETAD